MDYTLKTLRLYEPLGCMHCEGEGLKKNRYGVKSVNFLSFYSIQIARSVELEKLDVNPTSGSILPKKEKG